MLLVFERTPLLHINLVLLMFGFSVYLKGFFPIKTSIEGFAQQENFTVSNKVFESPPTSYDRVILMLIDALRVDFVFDDQRRMPFLRSLIDDYHARNYILKAHLPTVTLPRLKSITTGGIPGFVDVILNFDTRELTEDNLISQLKRSGRKIVFYGDDTWMRLFPDHFERSDGTTSFFVTDYTEVDNNVTRHLEQELSAPDWGMMILHYLGLDHIGHTAGPKSPLMEPKLEEMDNIVKKIYQTLEKQADVYRSLVLICGDHGMSDQGGHGGATDSEIMVPAVFLSPQYPRDTGVPAASIPSTSMMHHQIDLAATLSVLLGTPIPLNNLGQVLLDALPGFTTESTVELLHINAEQIVTLLKENVLTYETVNLHEQLLSDKESSQSAQSTVRVISAYQAALQAMIERITRSLTKYDVYAMTLAVLLLCLVSIFAIQSLFYQRERALVIQIKGHTLILTALLILAAIFCHLTACTNHSYHSDLLCRSGVVSLTLQLFLFNGILFLLLATVLQGKKLQGPIQEWYPSSCLRKFLLAGALFQTVSLVSSSFVEEEHQTWYHLTMSLHTIVLGRILYCHIQNHGKQCKDKLSVRSAQEDIDQNVSSFLFYSFMDKLEDRKDSSRRSVNESRNFKNRLHYNKAEDEIGGNVKSCSHESEDEKQKRAKLFPWRPVLAAVMVVVTGRLARSINQTGNKWLDHLDAGDWLNRPENSFILKWTVNLSLIFIAVLKWRRSAWLENTLLIFGLMGVFRYRTVSMNRDALNNGIHEARFVYGVMLLLNLLSVFKWLNHKPSKISSQSDLSEGWIRRLQLSWLLLMVLLLQPHSTILVAMIALQEVLIDRFLLDVMSLSAPYVTLVCLWMGQAVWYMQGNSNSLSTVVVSSGYVGLEGYQPVLVAMLLASATYAGPVFWFITLVKYLYKQQTAHSKSQSDIAVRFSSDLQQAIETLTISRSLTVCLYTVVTVTQRYHLFVWTVFSPKLLYEGVFTVVVVLVCVCVGVVKKVIIQW